MGSLGGRGVGTPADTLDLPAIEQALESRLDRALRGAPPQQRLELTCFKGLARPGTQLLQNRTLNVFRRQWAGGQGPLSWPPRLDRSSARLKL